MKQGLLLLISLLTIQLVHASEQYDLVVARDGSGNYTTIQAAIDAVPEGRTTAFRILIKNGTYRERVRIPATKPFIHLTGQSVEQTIITYNSAAKDTLDGRVLGTPGSSTFFVYAADFLAMNITFENSYGDGSQAVAASVYGDRSVFINCRFLGNQDTLLTYKSGRTLDATRQYYNRCYIEGNVDFIFGNSVAVFDSCTIYAKARTRPGSGYITAANTPAGQRYGYVFRNCLLPANGKTSYFLGRPWQNSGGIGSIPKSHTKVVFINTTMSASIHLEGWTKWDAATDTSLIYYAEYNSRYMDGSAVDFRKRVQWFHQLSDAEAASYSLDAVFAGWKPLGSAEMNIRNK